MISVWSNTEKEEERQIFRGMGLEYQFDNSAQPAAIKISENISSKDSQFLNQYSGPIVLDFKVSSNQQIGEKINNLKEGFSLATVLVLDTLDAQYVLNRKILSHQCMQEAARELLNFGAKSIFLLGSPLQGSPWVHDYWTNGNSSFWLTQKRFFKTKYSELRSILSAAIAASLARSYLLQDALIIAKMYESQAIRQANTSVSNDFPENEMDIPYLSSKPLHEEPHCFKRCHRLGLYPVVDCYAWVEMLLKLGVKTIQLRIKEETKNLEEEMKRSIALAKKHHATLFVNDYWELALQLNAEAVHLGQTDLNTADVDALRKKGLLLGVSTHCYHEVARAHALCPSYIAIGPIFPTTSKEMPFTAQGIECLKRWKRTLTYPLVAIGGINIERMSDVVATDVEGVALISAITKAKNPSQAALKLLGLMNNE